VNPIRTASGETDLNIMFGEKWDEQTGLCFIAHENGIVAGTIAREKRMRELSHRSKAFIRKGTSGRQQVRGESRISRVAE
jgi:hypothetical protein